MALRLSLLWLVVLASGLAQEVRVYSEFQRIDPFGAIFSADRAERPREILSPALVRNAYASFQVALSVPAGQQYTLFIGQNPENAVEVTLYKMTYARRGDAWVPDALQPLKLSDSGLVPDVPPQVPGQTTTALWMDVWVRPDAPVRRIRLEVQLNVGDRWIVYPMELRLMTQVIPAPEGPLEPLAPVEAPASESAAAPLRAYACAPAPGAEEGPLTIRRLIRRNARQDLALARTLEARSGKTGLVAGLLDAAGLGDLKKWCEAAAQPPRESGAEWYLKVRGFLYRTAGAPSPPDLPKPAPTIKPAP